MARKTTQATPQKRRPDWKPYFLDALRQMPNVTIAADKAGIHRATAYSTRTRSPEFADAWDEAMEEAADRVEAELHRRATEGARVAKVRRKYDGNGMLVERVEEESDGPDTTALIFYLKGLLPEKYGNADALKKAVADGFAALAHQSSPPAPAECSASDRDDLD